MVAKKEKKIDIGRLIVIPILTMLIVMNMLGLRTELNTLYPVTSLKAAKLLNQALTAFFYLLVVILYMVRTSARSTTQSRCAKVLAVTSAFLPFAFPLLGKQSHSFDLVGAASLFTVFGMLIALYALSTLGRSFSIIPQARELVQIGPYRYVRHPVYLGELIATFGIVIGQPSIGTVALYLLITATIIYRALHEEKLLGGLFPEYSSYSLNTARFIPGVF